MEARGHRPRSPRSLVADAIREAFEDVCIELLTSSIPQLELEGLANRIEDIGEYSLLPRL